MRIVSFAALLPLLPLCSASSSSGVVRKRSQVNHVSKGEEAVGQGVRQRQLEKGEEEEVVEPAASTSVRDDHMRRRKYPGKMYIFVQIPLNFPFRSSAHVEYHSFRN